jgi:hypothetical protein
VTTAKLTRKHSFVGCKEPPTAPLNLYQWLVRLSSSTISVNGYGLVAVFLCFHQSLSCYFLADDFMHLNYLKQVFAGNPGLLLQNFWSTWLQTQGTSFYRPLISLTMAMDYLLWQYSAWGYHFSNLIFYFLCSMGIYFIAKEIDNKRFNGSFPLIASSLFIFFPLHTEVATWIIARVDSVCACFYFFSFYFFLRQTNKLNIEPPNAQKHFLSKKRASIFSLSFFVLALLSKEMAVVLPLTLAFYLFFFPSNKKTRLGARFKEILARTYIYWIILCVYLLVRTLALGSFVGGYQGSLADSNFSDFLHRFIFKGGWEFFFYPYNREIFQSSNKLVNSTSILYTSVCAFFLICSLAFKSTIKRSSKLLLFCLSWFLLSLLPTITVWNLTESLSGARFAFLASAPFCLALAAMISVPVDLLYLNKKAWSKISTRTKTLLTSTVAILFLATTSLNFYATKENNLAWYRASQEVRALKEALENESKKIGPQKNLALLNIPNRYAGAHMIYNGSMLYILLQPPLVDASLHLSERVHTFEPALFGPPDLLNFSRLEQMNELKDKFNIYFWNRDQKRLSQVRLDSQKEDIQPDLIINKQIDLTPGKIFGSPILDIKSGIYKFVQLFVDSPTDAKLALTWNEPTNSKVGLENAIIANYDQKSKSFIFPLSEHKSWLLTDIVHRLFVVIASGNSSVRVNQLRLLCGNDLIPSLRHHDFAEGYLSPDGIFYLTEKMTNFKADYNLQNVTGAKSARLEVSRPNTWFEHTSKSFRDNVCSEDALFSKSISELNGTINIETKELKGPGYYEMRIAALDANKNVVGYFSDPLIYQMAK